MRQSGENQDLCGFKVMLKFSCGLYAFFQIWYTVKVQFLHKTVLRRQRMSGAGGEGETEKCWSK